MQSVSSTNGVRRKLSRSSRSRRTAGTKSRASKPARGRARASLEMVRIHPGEERAIQRYLREELGITGAGRALTT